jgi:regulator of sirC expression with transglutaminase-like and TPR domain
MLDRVVDRRSGHPYALAVVYAAIGARCGIDLYAVGAGPDLLLADRGARRTVLVDPVPGGRKLGGDPRWLCPHLVALLLVEELGARFGERGDLTRAIRAAELRLQLPLDPRARERHELELRSLRARLN